MKIPTFVKLIKKHLFLFMLCGILIYLACTAMMNVIFTIGQINDASYYDVNINMREILQSNKFNIRDLSINNNINVYKDVGKEEDTSFLLDNTHELNDKQYELHINGQEVYGDTIYLDDDTRQDEKKENLDTNSVNRLQHIDKNASKKLPRAIIIGVKKGGTRALLEFLRIHPDIRAPGSEIHFFDKHFHKGFKWYRKQMPSTLEGQITVEKTPSYFITKDVPRRVHMMSKHVKLIVVVRDPVTRAISDYTQSSSKRHDLRTFEELVYLDNTTGLIDTSWAPVKIGIYAKHLERWLQYFPLSNIHFVSGEELIKDPANELAAVQNFLWLKKVITDKHFYFNASRGFPCLKKQEKHGRPHCLGGTKGHEHPNIHPKVIKRLRNFFKPFNHRFYQMTGRDFNWR